MDITNSLELKVSSRVAMVGSLNDNSTETFWESCEEDRNKCKWVMVSTKEPSAASEAAAAASSEVPIVGGNGKTRIKSISVHIDNGRDLGNKVLHLTFKGGRNPDDLHVLKQYDVESRFAGWVTCFIGNY